MDACRNVSVSGGCHPEQGLSPACSKFSGFSSGLDDLFSAQNTEVDVSLEWLSIYVEDCFSNTGSYLPAPTNVRNTSSTTSSKLSQTYQKPHQNPSLFQNFAVPCKARSKRKRVTTSKIKSSLMVLSQNPINPENQTLHLTSWDPPLLKQSHWLADSELIVPKNQERGKDGNVDEQEGVGEEAAEEEVGRVKGMVKDRVEDKYGDLEVSNSNVNGWQQMPRRCTHCLAQRTPQWRAGPLGPKTLCNACGVRYKSGRLLPEYRPAKSPTFVSYLHSNSHKKVMEMRMALLSSVPPK